MLNHCLLEAEWRGSRGDNSRLAGVGGAWKAMGIVCKGYFWEESLVYVHACARLCAQQNVGNKGSEQGLRVKASCAEKLNLWLHAVLIWSLGAHDGFNPEPVGKRYIDKNRSNSPLKQAVSERSTDLYGKTLTYFTHCCSTEQKYLLRKSLINHQT